MHDKSAYQAFFRPPFLEEWRGRCFYSAGNALSLSPERKMNATRSFFYRGRYPSAALLLNLTAGRLRDRLEM